MEFLSRKLFFLLIFCLVLLGCDGEVLEKLDSSQSDFGSWCPHTRLKNGLCPNGQFSSPSDYIFDSQFIEVRDGSVFLKKIDTTFSGSDFDVGTHAGTYVLNKKLEMKTAPSEEETHINSILPGRSSNLIGYWRFENNLSNHSSRNFSQSSSGVINYDEAVVNNGVRFLSTSSVEVSDIGNTLSGRSSVTISFWGLVDSTVDTWRNMLSFGPGYFRFETKSNPSDIAIYNPGLHAQIVCDGCISPNTWQMITYTADGSNYAFYINGSVVASGVLTGTMNVGPSLYFGARETGSSLWKGMLDEVIILDEGISGQEVQSLYEAQKNVYSEHSSEWTPHWSDVVGYWKMDGSWHDSSSNGNHGTPAGDSTFISESKIGLYAGSFDGATDYISLGDVLDIGLSDQSFSGWIRPHTEHFSRVIAKNSAGSNGWWLGLSSGGRYIAAGIEGIVATSAEEYRLNEWQHIVVTWDRDGELSVYLNAKSVASVDITAQALNNLDLATSLIFSGRYNGGSENFDGDLDDFILWRGRVLNQQEVSEIYHRQKQKYAASYRSQVIDVGSLQNIERLSKITDLPFTKELTKSSESSSDYTSLSGNLSTGLVAYYPFSKPNYTGSANEVLDMASGVHHGETSSTGESSVGIIGFGKPRGVGVVVPASQAPVIANNFSIAFWMKGPNEIPSAYHTILSKGSPGDYLSYIKIQGRNSDRRIGLRLDVNGTGQKQLVTNTKVLDGKWHHIAFISDGSEVSVYVDGKYENKETFTIAMGSQINDPSSNMPFGGGAFPYFDMDEIGIWSRELSEEEVKQLYRRGANRVKYQVRTCVDSTCSTEPDWKGPGGDGTTYFSELFNRASTDLTSMFSVCDSSGDNLCSTGEFSLEGSTQAGSLEYSFVDSLINNYNNLNARYFQYRVLMEAEENTACDGEPCLPSLNSISFDVENDYYANAPSVSSKKGIQIESKITKVQEEVEGSCLVKYQFSKDGSSYFYFNSGSWVSATDSSVEANVVSEISTKLKNFISSGRLYFRAYLISDGAQSCRLKNIRFY